MYISPTATHDNDGHALLRHNAYVYVTDAKYANQHAFSTLSGYGAQYRDYDGPEGPAKYAKALERNEGRAVWLNALATVIYSGPREPEKAWVKVQTGDVVRVVSDTPGEGGLYVVTAPHRYAGGDSSRLIPYAPENDAQDA